MSTDPDQSPGPEGLNWSPPEPTPTVAPGAASSGRPAGSAAPGGGSTGTTQTASPSEGSPLDGVIAKLPPNVQEKPEALVGVAFGAGLVTAFLLRVVGR